MRRICLAAMARSPCESQWEAATGFFAHTVAMLALKVFVASKGYANGVNRLVKNRGKPCFSIKYTLTYLDTGQDNSLATLIRTWPNPALPSTFLSEGLV